MQEQFGCAAPSPADGAEQSGVGVGKRTLAATATAAVAVGVPATRCLDKEASAPNGKGKECGQPQKGKGAMQTGRGGGNNEYLSGFVLPSYSDEDSDESNHGQEDGEETTPFFTHTFTLTLHSHTHAHTHTHPLSPV